MKHITNFILVNFVPLWALCQAVNLQTEIMVVPYTKENEDVRTVMDNDKTRRLAIIKVKEGLDNKGIKTIDFIGKLKALREKQMFKAESQSDYKSKIIEMSGCDVYVVVEVDAHTRKSPDTYKDLSGVSVTLTAYEVATGNSIASKAGSSGEFETNDIDHLTSSAVNKCIDEFADAMNKGFKDAETQGHSVYVDISFAEGSSYTMNSTFGKDKTNLSIALENWMNDHAVGGNYHSHGSSPLTRIFEDVKIPLKDSDGKNYSADKFAASLIGFLQDIGVPASQVINTNTIYITIN